MCQPLRCTGLQLLKAVTVVGSEPNEPALRNQVGGGGWAIPRLKNRASSGSVRGILQVTESLKEWELGTQAVGCRWNPAMEPAALWPRLLSATPPGIPGAHPEFLPY